MTTARILSIDGGGIRGLIPAMVLAAWEKQLTVPIASLFHLVAGTSTGGIIASALCRPSQPVPAKELIKFYLNKGPDIFKRSVWQEVTSLWGAVDERYDAKNLEKALGILDGRLKEVEERDLLVPAYDIENRDPFFFKSWKARGIGLKANERADMFDFALADVARATSAAPTVFEPARVQNSAGERYALVDGGMFANNPAMCAYAAARKLYSKAERFLVVSMGTGQLERAFPYNKARNWGFYGWARRLLPIIFDGVSDTVDYQLDQLAAVDHFRFQISLGRDPNDAGAANDNLDDASPGNLKRLQASAERLLSSNDKEFNKVLAELQQPMTPRNQL